MGDRCWLRLCWNKADTKKVFKSLGIRNETDMFAEYETDGQVVSAVDEQANYGMQDELTKLAKDGVTFHGHHASGDDYGAEIFCGIDGKYYSVASADAEFTVRVDSTGEVDAQQLAEVRDFIGKHKQAVEYVKKRKPGKR